MENTNTHPKTQSKINKLRKSIELQERIKSNLESMSIAAPESIQCCDRIIAQLKAQKAIYEQGAAHA